MGINVCCGHLHLLGCADDKEHKHIGCDALSGLNEDSSPILENEHVKKYCLGDGYKACPYYPKEG